MRGARRKAKRPVYRRRQKPAGWLVVAALLVAAAGWAYRLIPVPPQASSAGGYERGHTAFRIHLAPGETREWKTWLTSGAVVRYDWRAQGGSVGFDLHAERERPRTVLSLGGGEAEHRSGELRAPFAGRYGWRFTNRGTGQVIVSVDVSGDFDRFAPVG